MRFRLLLPIAVAAVVVLVLILRDGGGEAAPATATAATASPTGAFSSSEPGSSSATFKATGLRPDDSLSGTVAVSNAGRHPGFFTLSQDLVDEAPGTGIGSPSKELDLLVLDLTPRRVPATVYNGRVADFRRASLGPIPPDRARIYSFTVSSPGPTGGGKGARVTLRYDWTATARAPRAPALRPNRAPVPRPKPAPRLRVRLGVPGVQHVLRVRGFVLSARCNRRCRVSGRAVLRIGRSATGLRVTVTPARATAGAVMVRLHVPVANVGALRQALRAGRPQVSLRLRVRARDRAGRSATARQHIRITRRR